MRSLTSLSVSVLLSIATLVPFHAHARGFDIVDFFNHWGHKTRSTENTAQLGPRPFYLVADMDDSALKDKLTQCADSKTIFKKTNPMKKFKIIEKLGVGTYSTVYKVKRQSDGKNYALKKVKLPNLSAKGLNLLSNYVMFLRKRKCIE